jgi:uncharacterized protein YqhQ
MAKKIRITIGSALENGVMFGTRDHFAIAKYPKVSELDKAKAKRGEIELKDENELEITSGKVDAPAGWKVLSYIPIIAGIVALYNGIFGKNDKEPWKSLRGAQNVPTLSKLGGFIIIGLVYAVLAGFSYLVGSWIAGLFGIAEGTFWYGFMISLMIPLVSSGFILLSAHFLQSEMLNFHGAEHKVGNAFRKKLELTGENILSQSKIHPNCSTNLVINASIVFPFVIGALYIWLGSFALALLVGVVVEVIINIELLRISTWIGNNPISYIYNFFGMLAQRITVRDPEERHIRAAVAAMNKVLELERGEGN